MSEIENKAEIRMQIKYTTGQFAGVQMYHLHHLSYEYTLQEGKWIGQNTVNPWKRDVCLETAHRKRTRQS